MPSSPPPSHVLAAFGAPPAEVAVLAGGRGGAFRVGDTVLRRVHDPAAASFLATTFEQLRVSGIRIARPVRASDGRWVVAGWSAQRFVAGRPEARFPETIEASVALHDALAGVDEPRFLRQRTDVPAIADRLAWGEEPGGAVDLGDGHAAAVYAELAAQRRPVSVEPQLVHGDMFGNVLFAGTAPPAVVGMKPFWRPAAWAAGVVAVDAVAWGDAGPELLEEWRHLPDWPQMVLRAVLFRLGFSLLHPRTTPKSLVEMLTAVEVIRSFLR
ncbi:TIGR02569 family protein [Nakamurella endophytica]|uniref:TIGR02569 family protein n=1 Tax=Nakamurella endophytica TaxID=1748367 RepID=A0A917TD14_9ACTN|nr:TIGR02569 family protein [Nakamurella endophytica]GGM17863.1 TIGR02569 family protein [Nakamurella endophytica]